MTTEGGTDQCQKTPFEILVGQLSEKLGPCSGINSDDVDKDELQRLMKEYVSEESHWKKYFFPNPDQSYTRNLVDKGNGKSNLLILVWTPNKASQIHDHANAHCIMKILKGSLVETRYRWPTVHLNKHEMEPLQCTSQETYNENDVTYMSDTLGLHRVSNPDPNEYAVSLHLYTPPNAAVYGCKIFDEATGEAKHIKMSSMQSEYGKERKPRL